MTIYGRGLRGLALATVATITIAFALVFFYAPLDADQGFIQKIFYIHVPLAIVSLCGFVLGGIFAIAHLRTDDRRWDMRSYVAIHMALIFSVGALITGSIWAKASWGHWWVWNEPTLVSFLIVVLLFATYQPMRFSIEDPERQARYASVFAIVAGAFVPLNFIAVRLAQGLRSPARADPHRRPSAGVDAAHVHGLAARDRAAVRDAVEVRDGGEERAHADPPPAPDAARRGRGQAAATERRAVMTSLLAAAPALPLHTAGKYVAGAYIVFLALVLDLRRDHGDEAQPHRARPRRAPARPAGARGARGAPRTREAEPVG